MRATAIHRCVLGIDCGGTKCDALDFDAEYATFRAQLVLFTANTIKSDIPLGNLWVMDEEARSYVSE